MENENVVNEAKTTAEYNDAGWDDTETSESKSAETKAEPAKEETKVEAEPEAKTDTALETKAEITAEPAKEPTIHVKHLDEEKDLTLDEARTWAQKGMDYDRVKEKWDNAKDVYEFISQQAKSANMNPKDFINFLRTEQKKQSGMTDDEAKRTVELENRESEIAVKEAEKQEHEAEAKRESESKAALDSKKKADLDAFASKYPDVAKDAAKLITKDMWKRVGDGESLITIWQEHVIEQLTTEKESAEKNVENSGHTTGSVTTSGGENMKKDPMALGWDD